MGIFMSELFSIKENDLFIISPILLDLIYGSPLTHVTGNPEPDYGKFNED